ncbi:MAG: VOC family protein [Nitrososphaerota archaeon]|nr:VOC family protein [Nitrososphaerota archaeon]MDG6990484.1 VOC family protein [Nitrososphaerota archaeon]
MTMRITQITIVVKDQAASLEFFTSKVGFEKKTDVTPPGSYRWVTVGPKGQDLELALWQSGSPDPNGWSKDWKPGGPPMVLWVDDCRKAFAEMKAKGVRFVQEPYEVPWGTSATFADPDGNMFSLHQPPSNTGRS